MAIQFRGVVVCLVLVLCSALQSFATVHTVGDSSGWNLGSDYKTLTSDKTFKVGDSLLFSYIAESHTVDEVAKSDNDSCTIGKSISSDSSGSTTIPLVAPATRYFICSTSGHCDSGMKVSVSVTGPATPSPPPPRVASPPPSTPFPPPKSSPPPKASPPPPPPPTVTSPPPSASAPAPTNVSPPSATSSPSPTISPSSSVSPPPARSPPEKDSAVALSPFVGIVVSAWVVAFFVL